MDFIGRSKELRILESEYSGKGSLTVIYGRRRVGKTTLITHFMNGKSGIYFLATQQNAHNNLLSFSMEVASQCGVDGIMFSTWESAMDFAIKQGIRIIAIDEFQYLAESDPALTSTIQHAWDTKLKNAGIMLILCGSYIGMMEKHTLNQSSPLYGRRSCVLKIEPLEFRDIIDSRDWDNIRSAIGYYGITGGVPRYMELIDPSDLRKSISHVILDRMGVLFEEPMFLLKNEVKEPTNYISILTSISKGNSKLEKISGDLQIKSNSLSPYLESLISMGILERRIPVTEETGRSRSGKYVLKDRFLRFWFRFVFPHMTSLVQGNKRETERELDEHLDDSFLSFVFEEICREHVLNGNLGEYDRVGSFWNSKTEVDIVALDMENKNALVCECKYWTDQITKSVLNDLIHKCDNITELEGFRKKFALFSVSGFDKNLISETANDVILVDMRNLIGIKDRS